MITQCIDELAGAPVGGFLKTMLPNSVPLANPSCMAGQPTNGALASDPAVTPAFTAFQALQDDLQFPSSVCVHGALWSHEPLLHLIQTQHQALSGAHPRRQRDYLLGRHCAASALLNAGYQGDAWLAAGQDKLPIWPTGWLGSISHAGEGAIAAVARRESCKLLGVDMEHLIEPATAADISHLVAARDELDLLSELGAERGLTLLFSAKEALYKALYPNVRQFFDFTAAQAIGLDDRLMLALTVPWGEWAKGTVIPVRFAFRDGYVFTAVYE